MKEFFFFLIFVLLITNINPIAYASKNNTSWASLKYNKTYLRPGPSKNNKVIYELGGPEIFNFHSLMIKMLSVIYRNRLIINLPFWLAKIMCPIIFVFNKITFKKIPLLITDDSVIQLKYDNVASRDFLGFNDLSIKPKSMDLILPSYLKHYRPRGNFSDL